MDISSFAAQFNVYFRGARIFVRADQGRRLWLSVACMPEPSELRIVPLNCYADEYLPGQWTTTIPPVATQPKITFTVAKALDGATVRRKGVVEWDLGEASNGWIVRVDSLPWKTADGEDHAGKLLWQPESITRTGSAEFFFDPPDGAQQFSARALAQSCMGIDKKDVSVECAKCDETASKDPVFFNDGNVQVSDADALPSIAGHMLARTYNSDEQVTALFGRGWTTLFDRRLIINSDSGESVLSLVSETNEVVTFRGVAGNYRQTWPQSRTATSELRDDTVSGTYVYRAAGSTEAAVFRASDGRLIELRDLRTSRAATINYDDAGLPQSITDSWSGVAWNLTCDPARRLVTSIAVSSRPDLVWTYTYDASGNLTAVTAPGPATWRTYEYINNRLTASRDPLGNLIESHTYGANGYGITSTGPSDEIASIQYDIATADPNERITRVTANNGNVTDYVLRASGGSWRTVRVVNGCGSCGARDVSLARDDKGRVVRRQHADGYITTYAWGSLTSGGVERLVSTQSAMKPAGCDPETSATRCMQDATSLATILLEATASTLTTAYEYSDPNWPERVTAVVTASTSVPGQSRREGTQYHSETGDIATRTVSGWTNGGSGPVQINRTTVTRFYGEGASPFVPAFAPGGNFLTEWLALPQPELLRKSIDGRRTDLEDVTSFVYYPIDASVAADLRGRLAATRNAAGHITRFEGYDVFGNVTRSVDRNGVVTELTYDILGRLVTTTMRGIAGCDTAADPLCATDIITTRTYNPPAGPLQSELRPDSGVTTYTYDTRGRVATISRGPSATDLRERIDYTYDTATGQKSIERILGFEDGSWVEKTRETYSYDSLRQLQSITHADATSVVYRYDNEGRVATIRDENHTSPNTTYTYDPAGRITKVVQTLSTATGGAITTRYSYDGHGNLKTVTDPNGNVTSYSYDDFGQMLSQQSPVTGTTGYQYDEGGNVTAMQDANGAVTQRTYDMLTRVLTATSTRGANTEVVTWSYDDAAAGRFAIGRLSTMTDPTGSTRFSYERRGLLREEARTVEGSTYTTNFQFDASGNRSLIRYPSSRTVQYTFDFAGRPQTASLGATPLVTSARYLPFGPGIEIAFGNGTTRRMQYDARYRMTRNELTGPAGIIAAYDYGFDAAGNITSIHDSVDAVYNRDFGYDDLNRLTAANTGAALWGTGTYSYDSMGNLTSASLGTWRSSSFIHAGTTPKLSTSVADGVSTDMRYDAVGNELTTAGSNLAVYSPRNHLLNAGADTYLYDGRGIRTITRSEAVRASSVTISPGVIVGGETATGTVTLNAPAPAGGVTVALSSSNASLVVPASVVVPAGAATATFAIQTAVVTGSFNVDVTATFVTGTYATATLVPSCLLEGISVAPTAVTGGASATGTVYLLEPAGAEGATVVLSSNHSAVIVPATLVIPAGATSASFSITTAPAQTVDVTITASLCGFRSTQLRILAATIANMSVSPAVVASGTAATATVDLTGASPAPGTIVTTTSSDATVATVPANITIPAGETAATFVVNTIPRDTVTSVVIAAADDTTTRSAALTVERCTPTAAAPAFAEGEVIWFDDALPDGALAYGTWQWDSAQKASGTQSSVDPAISGGHEHWFEDATGRLVPGAGDKLFVYVLVDPCNPPREIMIGWGDGGWEHRAYWGEDLFPYGTPGTGRIRFGDIPAAGEWVRLEVPASTFALEGRSIRGIALSVWGGRVWFDRAGSRSCDSGVPTPPASFPASEIVWYDDSTPPGATLYGNWTWDATQHASGTQSHVEPPAAAAAEHWFDFASNPITVGPGDTLFVYAYADPCNPPREIMIGWSAQGDWEHRAYWGEDIFPYATPGTGRFSMGWLPRGGGWVKLEVPATLMRLAGKTITGMAFSVYGGRVWFDRVGKTSCAMPPPPAPSLPGDEMVWIDDAPPPGAPLSGTWQWDASQKASGTQSMADPAGSGGREFWFQGTTSPMATGANDNLFVYVLVDPCEPPREIMIGWYDGSWEHRAYWGENIFPYGTPGTGRFGFGPIPEGGKWVRLEVPAAMMNLANKSITGMAFSVYGGRAWFDRAGKRSCTPPVAPPPSLGPTEVVWFDDATPAGAVLRGTWNWDTTQKASGASSNTAPAAPEIDEHWFDGATQTMTVDAGDNLFVYALIDPCDPPREIMIGWYDGSWEHRAYWGENLFPYGTPPTGRFAMGPIPEAGQWVRLEIPATIANLAGKTISGIALSVWGGKVWFDRPGKYACSAPVAPAPATAPGERVWLDDELPDGVLHHGIWQWDPEQKASGTRSHTGPAVLEIDEHWFERATETITIGPDEEAFVYVLTDPCDPPREIMIGLSDGMWEHRAYWGENLLPYGTPEVGRFRVGDLPVPGQWTKLTIPADKFNLAGRTINGMAFSVWGGKVWFDRVGVQPKSTSAIVPAPSMLSIPLPGPMTSAASRFDATTLSTNAPRRYSFYTPELNLLAETDFTSATTPAIAHEYIWFGGQPVAQIDAATNAVSWTFTDHLGTPILQTDATATVTWRAEYDPYGRVHSYRAGANQHQPLRFPGQENDGSTEISYNIHRWYRASAGRYTQADPVNQPRMAEGFSGVSGPFAQMDATSTYGYAIGNPVRYEDRLGLDPTPGFTPGLVAACALTTAQTLKTAFPKTSDKYKHCMISGLVVTTCGPPLNGIGWAIAASDFMGALKEAIDLIGPGNAEVADLLADFRGLKCGIKALSGAQTVDACCKGCYP